MPPLGAIALVVSLIAWASYVPVAKTPALRSTMWPTWLLQIVALGLGITALVQMANGAVDLAPMIMAAIAIANFVGFIFIFMTVLKIPTAPGRPEVGKRIQHVTLTSETGAQISPDDFQGKGPVLLIFFRGFW
jgi:tellurite resistance protein TehA-like permease